MKNKMGLVSALALAVVVLAACGSGDKTTSSTSESSTKDSSEVTKVSTSSADQSVIKGILKEDATVDGETVSFFLTEVTAVADPTEIAKGINEEGVILNAEISQVDGGFKEEDFKGGQALEVTLKSEAIMTRSLPPQIPGVSIISIKKL